MVGGRPDYSSNADYQLFLNPDVQRVRPYVPPGSMIFPDHTSRPQQSANSPAAGADYTHRPVNAGQLVDSRSQATQQPRPILFREANRQFLDERSPQDDNRTSRQSGSATVAGDPDLLSWNTRPLRVLLPADNEPKRLFESFDVRKHPKRFFTVGKVFLVLWAEPAGDIPTTVSNPEISTGQYGQRVYSKIRRFVVIREQENYCSALPILTYNGQGVAKRGVKKFEHAIVYTGRTPPTERMSERPAKGESGMQGEAIRVNPVNTSDKLDAMSRIDFGKVHTIQHNIKVKSFGQVNPKSMAALLAQFSNIWSQVTKSAATATHSSSTHQGQASQSAARRSLDGKKPIPSQTVADGADEASVQEEDESEDESNHEDE